MRRGLSGQSPSVNSVFGSLRFRWSSAQLTVWQKHTSPERSAVENLTQIDRRSVPIVEYG
ncbi:Uncharacterised protein [Vibrio cholerae]|nr:Uncharacterised protein [Vibrio cholerae]CSI43895.1 Uncharacterised protein [Vibrio cholerae]CSI74629.1 Uncharacterised protein [Vibrio cholerae]